MKIDLEGQQQKLLIKRGEGPLLYSAAAEIAAALNAAAGPGGPRHAKQHNTKGHSGGPLEMGL